MGHCACVVSWGVFTEQQPELASQGRSLPGQHGVGLGFLATVRRGGRPRVHPMCPLISGDGLFVFIVASPKQIDLKRRGAYALHSFPCPTNEDAFYVTGRAELVSTTVAAPGSLLSSLPSVRRWPWLCHLTTMRCSSSTSTRVCSRGRRGTAIQRRIDTSGTRSTSSSGGRHILPVGVVANVAALGDEHGPFGLGLLGG
jgi:hypothetical protein